MIDKKPFRVTNEQIKIDLMLYDDDIECAKYAADLIDSRELIDKQEAIIKEMRASLFRAEFAFDEDQIRQSRKAITTILEKTKDYAD